LKEIANSGQMQQKWTHMQ